MRRLGISSSHRLGTLTIAHTCVETGVDADRVEVETREREGAREGRREVKVEVTATESDDPRRANKWNSDEKQDQRRVKIHEGGRGTHHSQV